MQTKANQLLYLSYVDVTQVELTMAQQAGYFKDISELHADLGELATGQKPGRQTPEERTMTANLGLALNDMAVAPLIYQKAKDKGIGTWLDL